jgi:hypothetical protein
MCLILLILHFISLKEQQMRDASDRRQRQQSVGAVTKII